MNDKVNISEAGNGNSLLTVGNQASTDEKFVVFRIGGQEFCVDIMCVRELRGWTQATPLPHSPPYVLGVINLRGIVLPVIDLAVRFGFAEREPSARSVIIVTLVGTQLTGLLVDAVSDILAVPRNKIQPTPDVASELAARFIEGVVALDNKMLNVVVLDDVLPPGVRGH